MKFIINHTLKSLLAIFLVLLSSEFLVAQKDYYPGFIVTNSLDTLSGMVKDRRSRPYKIYKKIYFQNDRGKKRKYGPNEIVAYQLGNSHFHSAWYDDLKFLRVMESGRVTYYVDESVDEYQNLFETKLLKRENENRYVLIIGIGFRQKTMKYFADCPELVDKLESREFRFNSLGQAVRFYNEECE